MVFAWVLLVSSLRYPPCWRRFRWVIGHWILLWFTGPWAAWATTFGLAFSNRETIYATQRFHEPRWFSRLDTKESSDGARGYFEIWYCPRRVLSHVQGWVFSIFHGLARGLLLIRQKGKQSRFFCRSKRLPLALAFFAAQYPKVNAYVKNRERERECKTLIPNSVSTRFTCFQEHQPAFGLEALPTPADLPFHPLNVKGKEIEAWPGASNCHQSSEELHSRPWEPWGRVSHCISYSCPFTRRKSAAEKASREEDIRKLYQ